MLSILNRKQRMPDASQALRGRAEPIATGTLHFVNGNPLLGPYPEGFQKALFGMGCFWGVERLFWSVEGVWVTSVGYAGGYTPNPTYQEVCTGKTGHNEVVEVVYDPGAVDYPDLLKIFWESHDPTQGMRQGNDIGTQYRSGIYCHDEDQYEAALVSRKIYGDQLSARRFGPVTTEIMMVPDYYLAEEYHQQYLARMPGGYCGLRGTGVACLLP